MKTINSKSVFITSVNRSTGEPNDFSININSDAVKASEYETMRLVLDELTINRNWSEVQTEVNDTIVFTDENDDETTYQIPEGNYTVYTLRDALNTLLTGKFTVSYNIASNKYTFTASNPNYKLYAYESGQFLGLTNHMDYTGTFSSSHPINLTYFNTIYLNCDIPSSSHSIDNLRQNGVDTGNILARIPITAPYYSNITYTNLTKNNGIRISGQTLDTIRFWLTTDKNTTLNLNSDWDFSLRILYLA